MMIEVVDIKMDERPRILTFVRYYLPGYKSGGPVRTIANMVEHLGDDFDFHIITSDRDALDTKPYEDIIVNQWNQVGKAKVFYASPSKFKLKEFAGLIKDTPHDIIYLNSFFDPVFTMRPLLASFFRMLNGKPVVLASRGEFSQGALGFKSWKKRFYISFINICGLYQNVTWQASSSYEASDIKKALGKRDLNIEVAPNLPPAVHSLLNKSSTKIKVSKPLQIIFLSRISPKKNLDFALEVLKMVSVPVDFNIYGMISDESYWIKCQNIIKMLPPHINVFYKGHIEHEKVIEVLSQHDLFFLPTRGENYGHVIFEALAAGLPVLISDQTPWRNLEEACVGWDLPLSSNNKFIEVIDKQANLTIAEYKNQKDKAREYAYKISSDIDIIEANKNMFVELLKGENNDFSG